MLTSSALLTILGCYLHIQGGLIGLSLLTLVTISFQLFSYVHSLIELTMECLRIRFMGAIRSVVNVDILALIWPFVELILVFRV